jgi:hypothetical protein
VGVGEAMGMGGFFIRFHSFILTALVVVVRVPPVMSDGALIQCRQKRRHVELTECVGGGDQKCSTPLFIGTRYTYYPSCYYFI